MRAYAFTLFVFLNSIALPLYAQSNLLSVMDSDTKLATEYMALCISQNPSGAAECLSRCMPAQQNTCSNIQQRFGSCWVPKLNPAYLPNVPQFEQPFTPEYLSSPPTVQYCLDYALGQ